MNQDRIFNSYTTSSTSLSIFNKPSMLNISIDQNKKAIIEGSDKLVIKGDVIIEGTLYANDYDQTLYPFILAIVLLASLIAQQFYITRLWKEVTRQKRELQREVASPSNRVDSIYRIN